MRLVAIGKGAVPKHALRGSEMRDWSLPRGAWAGNRDMGTCIPEAAGLCRRLPAGREDGLPRADRRGTGHQRPELDLGCRYS